MFDSVSFHDPVDEILARARLQLICERGKAALGEGNNSIGDIVPSLFAERDIVDVCVWTSSCRPTTAPRNAPRSKSVQTSRIAAFVPVGPARTRADISLPAVVVRVSSKPCGWLPLAAATKSTRQSRTAHTLEGRGRVSYYGGRLSQAPRRMMPPNFPFLQTSACSLTCSLLRSIETRWSVPRLPRSSLVTMAIVGGYMQWPSFNRTKGRASRRLSSGKLKIASLRWGARRSICTYDNRTSQ